ncbi:hypothetical protein CLAFUW4_01398 [Fulvia fulva]|uniref:Uncharacterized protein n=1 Tax=Passalora fulva TaxID=5499 RepID=A0A9Q8L8N1_PASFU|nr:uncharacterized protein CLAFUR5_01400 [Fulvia fulva]KAK4635210.1 hypothetical protein CLAFUR4_01399 [Fulvia fulva]KAK4638455.1 hypothetical protein CLAFUR0_01400 [Fulvia fulva]UJO12935.1 hypothetical protein CLAFUR5_01400 [Fulvia fulva]WPV08636.1 hypothetical protein CLAFUW4_01398 [Fulvia fulva]WPV23989.1 hypothetical protein CLAFUW7_01403 [Fulvia fulva]
MPYAGRGGAGNIQAVEQEKNRIAADLEAGQAAAESISQPPPPREEKQYAHSGRGGAGNYYNPKELSNTGVYKDSGFSQRVGNEVNTLGHEPLPHDGEQVKKVGRGGAGNYAAFDASEGQTRALEKRLEADREMREMVKKDVEERVKSTLAEPPKAKIARGEPY